MFHKIARLEYLDGTKLKIVFQDGNVRVFDMASVFDSYEPYKKLIDRSFFVSGRLNHYGIIWDDEVDMEGEYIYEHGEDAGTEEVPSGAMVAYAVTSARVKAGFSQQKLSRITGIDQADISKIESGRANPSISTLDRIASALGAKLSVSIS